jgi:hypothetical protein
MRFTNIPYRMPFVDQPRAELPTSIAAQCAVAPCQPDALLKVGAFLHRLDGERALSDDELEIHIEDCAHQWMTAYERFQLHGSPHDRDEALLHLHRMNTAILARSPAVQACRHADFEQRLVEQIDYFQSEHALALGRTTWRAA